MIKALKAKWKKATVQSKLNYLKKEWVEGRATNADMAHWKKSLEEYKKDIQPYIKEDDAPIEDYTQIVKLFFEETKQLTLSKESVAALVFSGIKGDTETLKEEIKKQRQEGDAVFVLGDLLPEHGDKREALQAVMELVIKEGVIFIASEEEKERMLQEDWTEVEKSFISRLKNVADTEDYSLFSDHTGVANIDLNEILDGEVPNLSNKLFIYPVIKITILALR